MNARQKENWLKIHNKCLAIAVVSAFAVGMIVGLFIAAQTNYQIAMIDLLY